MTVNQMVLVAALFLAFFANVAFFKNLAGTFHGQPNAVLHMIAIAVVLLCAMTLFLLLFSFRRILKPALTVLFVISAVTAYFMDTYNIVIDRDMLVNAASTDSAETWDLITPKMLMYVVVMGIMPSVLLWSVTLVPATIGSAVRARFKLAGIALVTMVSIALLFSSFFASFVREHKLLRYYTNPLTPIYSAYRFAKKGLPAAPGEMQAIGMDSTVSPHDGHRELIIMVVGETARADRFSLNGYERNTNPRLEHEDVISFSDVQSCGTSTAISVPCMFDMEDRADFNSEESAATENVLDVLSRAGVTMLWRDNNSNSKGVADRIPFEDFRSPETNPNSHSPWTIYRGPLRAG